MVINFIIPSLGTSGGINVVYKYVYLLKARGHDVCVYKELKATNMHRYKSGAKNIAHQIYCTLKAVIQRNKYYHAEDRFVWKLSNQTVRDADIVVATAWPTAYKVATLSNNKGEKFYFIQDYEIWDNAQMAKKSYELSLKKIVISTWINDRLKKDLGIGPFPIVYNGLDLEIFHPLEVQKNKETYNFLMLNHILPKKGVDNGIKVFEKVKNKYKNCKLRMFGMCDGANLPEYVEYYQNPSKQTLLELYSISDIFIFPSLEEGWGLTPLEAMACGCIVVGTNVGFVLDLGKHGENMMISEPGNIDAMVDNISKLLNDNELKENIKSNTKDLIATLDWDLACKKLETLFLEYGM